MNRRQFTASLGAAAGATAIPLPVSGLSATTATATSAAGDSYLWASFVARVQGKVTPETLVNRLQIAPDRAGKILAELVHDNVVNPMNANGVCSTVNPITNPWAGSGNIVQKSAEKMLEKAKDHAKGFIDQQIDETVEAEQEADA